MPTDRTGVVGGVIGLAPCRFLLIVGDSRIWFVLYALCVCPAIPARIAAVQLGRRLHIPPGALLGGSIAQVFLVWSTSVLVVAASASRIDS